MDGLLLVDKPAGWTSHDVVAKLRGVLQTREIGHAGTLDPQATGLLVIAVGGATRWLNYLPGDKSYTATLRLGPGDGYRGCVGQAPARARCERAG